MRSIKPAPVARRGVKRRVSKRTRPLRRIAPAHLIEPSPGTSIRTRLHLSERDEQVLRVLGTHLSSLSSSDLARAVRGDQTVAERKSLLTPACSARWAGSIVRRNDAQVALTRRCLAAEIANKQAAIEAINTRLTLPPDKGGYAAGAEHHGKRIRLEMLKQRVAACEKRLSPTGHLSIIRGGRRLFLGHQHLEASGITPDQWREDWTAAREIISANGSHDELGGNLTIRVSEKGICTIVLPTPLRHLTNTDDHLHYRLSALVAFPYRGADWLAQSGAGAINYTIRRLRYHATTAWRWYIDAAWIEATVAAGRRAERRERKEAQAIREAALATAPENDASEETPPFMIAPSISPSTTPATSSPPPPPVPQAPPPPRSWPFRFSDPAMSPFLSTARPRRSLGIDLNADHLAVWVLDASGNPVGKPYRIELRLAGLPASTRDGHLRRAISLVIALAHQHHAAVLFYEDLNWEQEKSREHYGHHKKFRHLISGFPTTLFRQRLVAMTARANLTVVAVDPAYTSQWGQAYWVKPTSTQAHPTTGHEAAALSIGRRGLSLRLRRRPSGIFRDRSEPGRSPSGQSTDASSLSAGVRGKPGGGPARPSPLKGMNTPSRSGKTVRPRPYGQAAVKQQMSIVEGTVIIVSARSTHPGGCDHD